MIINEVELFRGIEAEVMNQLSNICSEENYSNLWLEGLSEIGPISKDFGNE